MFGRWGGRGDVRTEVIGHHRNHRKKTKKEEVWWYQVQPKASALQKQSEAGAGLLADQIAGWELGEGGGSREAGQGTW